MKPSAETASRNRRSNWDAVSQSAPRGKAHPTPSSNSGTQFPDGGHLGKRIPLWSLILGHSFPNRLNGKVCPTLESNSGTRFPKRAQRETVSHSERQFWDAVSAWGLFGKLWDGILFYCGTHFPQRASTGKRVPEFVLGMGWGFRRSLASKKASGAVALEAFLSIANECASCSWLGARRRGRSCIPRRWG